MTQTLIFLMPWAGVLLALGCAALALHNNARRRLIRSLPTSRADGVFIGLVELSGTVEAEQPLQSHLAEAACVLYTWKVEEEWRRAVTSTDSRGRSTTRNEQGWNTVASGGETGPFYLKDESGAVLVHPDKAKLEPAALMNHTCGPDDPLYYGKGPPGAISHSTRRRRFTEHGFALHAPVFVIGRARERRDVVAPEVAHDRNAELFIISSRGEEKVVSGYRIAAVTLGIVGLILLLGMLVWWDTVQHRPWQTRGMFYAGAALGYGGCVVLGWIWSVYNGLIALRNRVRHGLALVDVQLQRRHDLIPNLLQIVQALKGHERQVQTVVAALRTQASASLPREPGADPQALAPALVALQEHYPELKSGQAFLALQQQITATENRIALARDYFNGIATHYNTSLERFPDRVVAALAGVQTQALLAASDFERAPVHVQFAD